MFSHSFSRCCKTNLGRAGCYPELGGQRYSSEHGWEGITRSPAECKSSHLQLLISPSTPEEDFPSSSTSPSRAHITHRRQSKAGLTASPCELGGPQVLSPHLQGECQLSSDGARPQEQVPPGHNVHPAKICFLGTSSSQNNRTNITKQGGC